MDKIAITEEMHLEKEWFEEAKKQTLETLPRFIDHIMNDYQHDYGTVCHAVSACALAAAWAADSAPSGGITGFQAGFVMWDFIKQWQYTGNKCGLRLFDFDKMLYPQYNDYFAKTIEKRHWEMIQEEAKKKLEEFDVPVSDAVLEHWKSIANGEVPFGYTIEDD